MSTLLWPVQRVAIKNLERSHAENRPRALIQMGTGSGKTFTAVNFIYRLVKFAGATPSKQTTGFFNRNLVMEYSHEQAVADGINVNFDVYRINTRITEEGSTIEAGIHVDKRDRLTRKRRWELLDEDLDYGATQLDRDVVAKDQIRTVIRTFRDKLFTEIFPGRSHVPKTLIFAKDDSHAEDIVEAVREEFAKGNEFCQKITYRTIGRNPEDLIAEFRNSYNPGSW